MNVSVGRNHVGRKSRDRVSSDEHLTYSASTVSLTDNKLSDCSCLQDLGLQDAVNFDLSNNSLREFPLELCKFHFIERISLSQNRICTVPETINSLTMLVDLDLSGNKIESIPPALLNLRFLEVLKLKGNRLTEIKEDVKNLQTLMSLDVSCNQLVKLPEELSSLKRLRILRFSHNQIKEIPTELTKLCLTLLDASFNHLHQLPIGLHRMSSLIHLHLDNNPLESPPASVVHKGRLHIFKFLASLENSASDDTTQVPPSLSNSLSIVVESGYRYDDCSESTPSLKTPISAESLVHNLRFHRQCQSSNSDISDRSSGHLTISSSDTSAYESVASHASVDDELVKELTESVKCFGIKQDDKQFDVRDFKQKLIDQYSVDESQRQKIRDRAKRDHADRVASLERRRNDAKRNVELNTDRLSRFDKFDWSCSNSGNADGRVLDVHPDPVQVLKQTTFGFGGCTSKYSMLLNRTRSMNSRAFERAQSCRKSAMEGCTGNCANDKNGNSNNSQVYRFRKNFSSTSRQICIDQNKQDKQDEVASTSKISNNTEKSHNYTVKSEPQNATSQLEYQSNFIGNVKRRIENALRVTLSDNFAEAICDGVTFCRLANQHSRKISIVYVPSRDGTSLSSSKRKKNVESFLDVCRSVGVDQNSMCDDRDVTDAKNTFKVAVTVNSFLNLYK